MAMMALDTNPPAEPAFLPRQRRWIVGVDLGQSQDATAICVLEYIRGVLDPASAWERHSGVNDSKKQKPAEQLRVGHLERLPLGKPYPWIVDHVRKLLLKSPLVTPQLVLDETGCGRPVCDLFDQAGIRPRPVRVTITAGGAATFAHGSHHVAKSLLVSGVDAALHMGTLQFAADLPEAETMKLELQDFRRHVTDAGRATYQARVGQHDDLVLSVALSVWWASRPVNVASWGRY
jgi:hypothetical protein